MDRRMRTAFTAAAALALAVAALPARADDRGLRYDDRDCERRGVPAPGAVAPAPYAYGPAPVAPVAAPYRHAQWRGAERRELRHEYRRLEVARERFYATWHGNPWSRQRFDNWYAARRAQLDQLWAELDRW